MLRDEAFIHLIGLNGKEALDHLYSIVERQIARIQHGMRSLTDSHCNVCLKLVRSKAFEERDGLVTVCYGPAVPLARRAKSLILPVNEGIAAEALIRKEIAYSNDILSDDRFWPRERRSEIATVYRTALSSPIIVNGTVRGVLCFDWAKPQMYDPKHQAVVEAFTDIVSTAFYISIQSHELVSPRKIKK